MIDVFKVGVHIGMTTNGTEVLAMLLRDLGLLHGSVKKLEQNMGNLKYAAAGAVAAFAGFETIKGLWHMVEASKELNHQLEKIKIGAGLTDAQTAFARMDAYTMAQRIPGTRVEDAVKVQRELYGTFGNMGEVHDALPGVLTANSALSRYGDTTTDVAQVAIRALEMRGHIGKDGKVNIGEFNKELDSLTRSIIASEGLLKPNDYLQAIRQAGPAATAMSPDAFWGMMPAAMVGMGSAKAGTALNSLFGQVIGHVLAGKRIAVAMQDAGMLKPGSWKVERGGHVLMDKDAVIGQNEFASDPFTYIHNLIEHLKTQKDKHGNPVDSVGIIQDIFQMSSRATSARLMNDVGQNWSVFVNERSRYERSKSGADASAEFNAHDLAANVQNLDVAWRNFMTALGEQGVPVAIHVLQAMTDALNGLTAWAVANPNATRYLLEFSAGLAAITTLGGGMMVVGFGMRPFVTGVRALIGAFTAAEAVTSAATAGTLATSIGSVTAAIAAGAGVISAAAITLGFLAKIGSDHETPATQAHKDALDKARRSQEGGPNGALHDGFDAMGRPVEYAGPTTAGQSGPILVHVVNQPRDPITGLSNGASRPSSGPSGFDWRASPAIPGLGVP